MTKRRRTSYRTVALWVAGLAPGCDLPLAPLEDAGAGGTAAHADHHVAVDARPTDGGGVVSDGASRPPDAARPLDAAPSPDLAPAVDGAPAPPDVAVASDAALPPKPDAAPPPPKPDAAPPPPKPDGAVPPPVPDAAEVSVDAALPPNADSALVSLDAASPPPVPDAAVVSLDAAPPPVPDAAVVSLDAAPPVPDAAVVPTVCCDQVRAYARVAADVCLAGRVVDDYFCEPHPDVCCDADSVWGRVALRRCAVGHRWPDVYCALPLNVEVCCRPPGGAPGRMNSANCLPEWVVPHDACAPPAENVCCTPAAPHWVPSTTCVAPAGDTCGPSPTMTCCKRGGEIPHLDGFEACAPAWQHPASDCGVPLPAPP